MTPRRAILIDAMFTIFVPKSGLDRYEIKKRLIKKFLGRDVDVEKLKIVYAQKRAYWENILPAHHSDKWAIIDREIIRELLPDISIEDAMSASKEIAVEFLSNPDFYVVLDTTRHFLVKAKSRDIRVIIASNQDKEKLNALISQFGLQNLISSVYASTEIKTEKPDPGFFYEILRRENLQPYECVMIGNNPQNDAEAAENVGMTGILYDRHDQYPFWAPNRIVKELNEVWNLDLFQEAA